MKTKSLFLTFALFILSPMSVKAAVSTDVFNIPSNSGVEATINPSSYGSTSGATYSGTVYYNGDYPLVWMDNSMVWATTASPGKAKSVKIYWNLDGVNTLSTSIIYVYGRNTPYSGEETLGALPVGELLTSQAYDASSYHTLDISAYDCSYILVVGSSEGIAFSRLDIAWTVPDVDTYAITTTKTGSGTITVSPSSPVAVGATVNVKFTGSLMKNEVRSFTIDGESTVLSEDEYTVSVSRTFTMPAHAVDISAVFAAKPSRSENTVSINGTAGVLAADIESGAERTFTISTQYNGGTDPSYTAGLKSIETTSGKVLVVSSTFNPSTSTGTVTLRGMAAGSDAIVITTYQTNGCQRRTGTINITVTARDVVLVTELNDKYYAVPNSFSAGAIVTAQELLKSGDNYYYKSGVNPADITWKAENTADGFYVKNGAGKYLKVAGTTMSLADASYEWYKNAYDRFVTGFATGMCYDEGLSGFSINGQNDYASNSAISPCLIEISPSRLLPAKKYTRGLTDGNYATMCLPFPVTRSDDFFSGVEVYNLTGKFMDGSTLTGIEITEETGALVAGKPYIILATANEMNAWYGVETAVSPVSTLGLVGNLSSDPLEVPTGCYGIASNQIRKVVYAGTAFTGQYKAYIDLTGVPTVGGGGASAPGRYVLYAASEATSVEDLLNNASLINWNEPVYNMLGQRVGRGTTGVLIQNGQKFLVK